MYTYLVFFTGLTAFEYRGHISFISEAGGSEVGAQEMALIGSRRRRLQALRGPRELKETNSLYCCSFSVYSESEPCRCFLEGERRGGLRQVPQQPLFRGPTLGHTGGAECPGGGPEPGCKVRGSSSHWVCLWARGQRGLVHSAGSLKGFGGNRMRMWTGEALSSKESLGPGRWWLGCDVGSDSPGR